jgi:hypothetical protein
MGEVQYDLGPEFVNELDSQTMMTWRQPLNFAGI